MATNPIEFNTYRSLPDDMYTDDAPVATRDPQILLLNETLLAEYEVPPDWFGSTHGREILAGKTVNADNPPIALAYAGHQFGQRVPLLGDGRAHLLGQMRVATGMVDVQLKGSGRTRFSRGGDGRATLASVLREYIVSEAMAGLGIPATRALAAIDTGEEVFREEPERGGILARTALSHIRVGSFQHAAANMGDGAVEALADYVLAEHFPELTANGRTGQQTYADLLRAVAERQARLIAQWMLAGFIHGVMNTDNMSVTGETIDFGPCAFIDEFASDKVFSSIDRRGRYAWIRQPSIGLWNLMRLAETLLPLLADDTERGKEVAEASLQSYLPIFHADFYGGLHLKLGLPKPGDTDPDTEFADRTLALLEENTIDMTVFFNSITLVAEGEPDALITDLFENGNAAHDWLDDWHKLRQADTDSVRTMRMSNPMVIARNHRVAEALAAATQKNDLGPTKTLLEALRNPYRCGSEHMHLQTPPRPEERVTETFCGT